MQTTFHCFRGKSDESNEPDNPSIISFITLIQRKCVQTDKLCQVYYACPVEVSSPGHLFTLCNRLKEKQMRRNTFIKKMCAATLLSGSCPISTFCPTTKSGYEHISYSIPEITVSDLYQTREVRSTSPLQVFSIRKN